MLALARDMRVDIHRQNGGCGASLGLNPRVISETCFFAFVVLCKGSGKWRLFLTLDPQDWELVSEIVDDTENAVADFFQGHHAKIDEACSCSSGPMEGNGGQQGTFTLTVPELEVDKHI